MQSREIILSTREDNPNKGEVLCLYRRNIRSLILEAFTLISHLNTMCYDYSLLFISKAIP